MHNVHFKSLWVACEGSKLLGRVAWNGPTWWKIAIMCDSLQTTVMRQPACVEWLWHSLAHVVFLQNSAVVFNTNKGGIIAPWSDWRWWLSCEGAVATVVDSDGWRIWHSVGEKLHVIACPVCWCTSFSVILLLASMEIAFPGESKLSLSPSSGWLQNKILRQSVQSCWDNGGYEWLRSL